MISVNLLFEETQETKKLLSNVLGEISAIKFFTNLGNAKPSKNVVLINSLEEAIEELKSENFEEINSIAWEYMRSEILKDRDKKKMWEFFYSKWKKPIQNMVFKEKNVKQFLKNANLNKDEFFTKLPFMGIIGEVILTNDLNNNLYFTSQLPIFKNGNLVCGYAGKENKKYPENKFKVW